jgi:serine/threonine-protein kinase
MARYELKEQIGRGGMAEVVLAFDHQFHRQVALKLLPKEFATNPSLRARFEREARLIAALEHPAIVPVYDFGELDGVLFLAMRYLSGGDLGQKLQKKRPLPPSEVVSVLKRVALALDYAHERGVIHRDIKPENIFFDEKGNSYLGDFGIARVDGSSHSLTQNRIVGTPAYMSPEQARGDAVDKKSDLYSFGAMVFHLLTGRPPYEAENPMGVALKHVTDAVPRACSVNPTLPREAESVLLRAMAKNPDVRYGSAREMVTELRRYLGERPLAVKPQSLPKIEVAPASERREPEPATPKRKAPQATSDSWDEPPPSSAKKAQRGSDYATLRAKPKPLVDKTIDVRPRPKTGGSWVWFWLLLLFLLAGVAVFSIGARTNRRGFESLRALLD